jgi:TolB-like protein/DNA-binding winged helix-turn-helix (wHTH) protein/Tfp pilus assembly protein PilF
MPIPSTSALPARFGPFEVDFRAGELLKNGRRIRLQDQPLQVLAMLLEHPSNVVTRDEFRQKLWPNDTFVDFDHGLNNAINKLRDALNDAAEAPRFIETLPRRGYRFISQVEREAIPGSLTPQGESLGPSGNDQAGPVTVPWWRSRWAALGAAVLVLSLVLGFAVNVWKGRFSSSAHATRIEAIAVLPLENLTGDSSQEYFVDGMTDALITDLAQIRALRVISRTSTMQYKGVKKPLPEIAKELHVDAILEGSVVRSGSRVRIDAQLIQAATDQHVWAKHYDQELRDVVTLQNEVARAVASEIQVRLLPQEQAQLATAKPVNPEAYENYLKARFFMHKWTADGFTQAIVHFQRAIEKDPSFALAYAGLSDSYRGLSFAAPVSPRETWPRAEAAARKALELDDSLGEAHASLAAFKYRFQWDWRGADEEYQRALALAPNNADVYGHYSVFLRTANRYQEAIAAAQRRVELDPLSHTQRADLGAAYLIARQYDQAIQELQKIVATSSEQALPHQLLGVAYEHTGQSREALAEFEKAVAVSRRDPVYLGSLAHAYARFGRPAEARKILFELEQDSTRKYVAPYTIALVWLGLDEKGQALSWLEKAYEDHSFPLVTINSWPWFDPLRSDAHFQDLVRRIGLDPQRAIPK